MDLKYLKKLRPILNKVGKKHGIPIEEGEFIIGKFFESFNNAITDPRVPKVKLPLIGTFYPKVRYIYRSLRASYRFYHLGGASSEYMKARIKRIWPVRNRLLEEANGKITWNEWRKKDCKERFTILESEEQKAKIRSREEIYGRRNNAEKSKRLFGEIQRGLHKGKRGKRKSK
jgi:hypothetical protein